MSQEQKEYEDHASTWRHASNSNDIIYYYVNIVRTLPRVHEGERGRKHNAMMIFDLYVRAGPVPIVFHSVLRYNIIN